jgi:peptide-methionine (S)-S-oxide reductase
MKSAIFLFVWLFSLCSQPMANENLKNTNQHMTTSNSNTVLEKATFGSGCFWCSEAIFSRITGVSEVLPGYAGGTTKNPSYEDVKTGTTGHAEVVQISYNPDQVSFLQLLEVFFKTHDPTTLNRQGADVGTQYRSVIFYHSDQQLVQAQTVKKQLGDAGIWDNPIVTEISPVDTFFVAEDYHHNYFERNPNQGYCQFVILPKVKKFEKLFRDMLAPTF